jgi:polysaccharide chain length determinant protein (PEP-CTERM system associated)
LLPGKEFTPLDALAIVRRRWRELGVPLVVIATAAAAAAMILPKRYRSETVILVIPQRVPESYVRSTVTARIEDRLQSISQQILSRTRLERVINDFDLYKEERKTRLMEDIVAQMRRDIGIEVVKGDAFRVTYEGSQPRTVQRVTDRLASLFIEENVRDRELLAEDTNEFLEAQLEDARRRLLETEQRLEEYNRRYSGELPTQASTNLQAMQNVQLQIQALVDSLGRDRDQKLAIERSIADLRVSSGTVAVPAAITIPVKTDTETPIGATLAEQIAAAQQALHALELRLTLEHPDVVRMKRLLRELETRAAEAARTSPESVVPVVAVTPEELARRNQLHQLQETLKNLDRQIATKEAEESRLRGLAASYQAKVDAVPTRQAELAELTRDYTTLQNIYNSLLVKREDSKIAANLERRQVGEQFKLIDPAGLPEKPISPNRLRINLIGGLLGLFLGAGLTALLEYRDTSFRTEADVTAVLALAVLARIPVMLSATERQRRRRLRISLGVAIALVMLLAGGAVAAWKLGRLPILIGH